MQTTFLFANAADSSAYRLRYETTYENYYPDAEHVYRVYTVEKQSGKVNELVSGILERKLHEQFAATENSTVFLFRDFCMHLLACSRGFAIRANKVAHGLQIRASRDPCRCYFDATAGMLRLRSATVPLLL